MSAVRDTETFEFKGNVLINFRVQISATTIYVSTHKKRGDDAVRTWTLPLSDVSKVHVHERIGRRTKSSGVYLTPTSGPLVIFSWLRSALGARNTDGETYYHAAAATLRAIAAHTPTTEVVVGPALRASYLIGAVVGLALGLYLVLRANGGFTSDLLLPAALVIAWSLYSVASSGVFSKRQRLSAIDAAALLTKRAEKP